MVGDDAEALFDAADAVIDFTSPAAAAVHAASGGGNRNGACVVGTTGLAADQEAELRHAATRSAIVWAPNMSVGVNLLLSLVEQVAASARPGDLRHRDRRDASSPQSRRAVGDRSGSGPGRRQGRGVALDDGLAARAATAIPAPAPAGDIGFATLRGGDVVGDHTVIFAADGERIEITHKASSRQIFARGAVRAARWASRRPPGPLFDEGCAGV